MPYDLIQYTRRLKRIARRIRSTKLRAEFELEISTLMAEQIKEEIDKEIIDELRKSVIMKGIELGISDGLEKP